MDSITSALQNLHEIVFVMVVLDVTPHEVARVGLAIGVVKDSVLG